MSVKTLPSLAVGNNYSLLDIYTIKVFVLCISEHVTDNFCVFDKYMGHLTAVKNTLSQNGF